ncbi:MULTISPECIES: hypothetical protein [unclassified Nonomuraea]|uniref:hypothetical protein n=1 Tax=unclassified Nonomuraea TaxID=2593643 RepID=UPI0033F5E2A2
MTSLARSVAVSVAPLAATIMVTGTLAALGAPLLLGVALGLGYDLALRRAYRGVPCPEGDAGQRRSLGSRVGSAYMRGQPRSTAFGRSS